MKKIILALSLLSGFSQFNIFCGDWDGDSTAGSDEQNLRSRSESSLEGGDYEMVESRKNIETQQLKEQTDAINSLKSPEQHTTFDRLKILKAKFIDGLKSAAKKISFGKAFSEHEMADKILITNKGEIARLFKEDNDNILLSLSNKNHFYDFQNIRENLKALDIKHKKNIQNLNSDSEQFKKINKKFQTQYNFNLDQIDDQMKLLSFYKK